MCHVAQDGEDDGGGKEACEGVDGADDQGVPVAVVVELVVASQGKESANADSIRVEDLSASVWGVDIIVVKGFLCNSCYSDNSPIIIPFEASRYVNSRTISEYYTKIQNKQTL